MSPLIQLKKTTPAILAAVACFALSPAVEAVSPAPDGGYPNFNTAEGQNALFSLSTGQWNTALGAFTLWKNTDGSNNTAVGTAALLFNIGNQGTGEGTANTAVGAAALLLNTSGTQNTAVGTDAMVHNDGGSNNNAVGTFALFNNIAGSNNTAVGDLALQNSTGDYNTGLGANAGTDPDIVSNNIYIGDGGFAGDTNVIAIGGVAASGTPYENCFIGGIAGASVFRATAVPVYVDTDGHLGTVLVDAKGNPSAALLRRGKGAQHQVMLNRKVEKLQATAAQQQKQISHQQKQISQQQRQIEVLMAQLQEQAAQIQKVSAQLEASKPAPQVVNNQ